MSLEWRYTAADQLISADVFLVTRVLVPLCACVSPSDSIDPLWLIFKIDNHIHLQCPVCGVTYCQAESPCQIKVEL